MSVRHHLGDTRSRLPVKCRDCLDVGHTCHIRASWEVVQTDGECWSAEPLPLPPDCRRNSALTYTPTIQTQSKSKTTRTLLTN
jgi:hypothetical protein